MARQSGPGTEEMNATVINLRRQRSFELRLESIECDYRNAMKKNYDRWLEALERVRKDKDVKKSVSYFKEEEWRSRRRRLQAPLPAQKLSRTERLESINRSDTNNDIDMAKLVL